MVPVEAALRAYRAELEHAPLSIDNSGQMSQVDRCLHFLLNDPACFERSNRHGHFTGSSLIVDPAAGKTLLVHHKKYNRWVQPGGHSDGIRDTFFTAWEEAFQESGLKDIRPIAPWKIADVNIQPVERYEDVPPHLHYDLRYFFRAFSSETVVVSDESYDVAWFLPEEMPRHDDDDELVRLVEAYFGIGSVSST